jgi:RNA polymerase sigma factor (sigma-70 family)
MSPSVTVRLLATQSDARLVELSRQGHERAFEALVQRYRRPLLAHCRRILLPEARAEDALQQALLQVWLGLERGDEVRDARAWLYRIVRNTALNALRGSGYDYAELSDALTGAHAPEEDLDRRIAVREALAGLAALPQQQREALLRTAVEGASHAHVAAEMGLSEGAVRGLVHRARVTLRTVLTAITPMPLASWAAAAAGHGGPAVADLAVGGGSAGVAGLLLKGGAVALTAGVLAAGVGGVEHVRHASADRAPRSAAEAHGDGSVPADVSLATAPLAPARERSAVDVDGFHGRGLARHRRAPREHSPEGPVDPRRSGGGDDGGGTSSQRGSSGAGDGRGDGGGGDGLARLGGRNGGDRSPGSGSAPSPEPGDGVVSGDGGGSRSGDGGTSGDGGDSTSTGADGGSASSGGSGGGSGSTNGSGSDGSGGGSTGGDGGTSGRDGGTSSGASGSTTSGTTGG